MTASIQTIRTTAPVPSPPRTRLLGATLITFSAVTAVSFGVLSTVFEFPDILRASGTKVLPLFADNAGTVRAVYWLLTMTGLALIAAAVELGRFLQPYAPGPARLVSAFGVATGVFWSLGYVRWPITVPYLSELYRMGDQQQAVESYEVLNRYAGMAVGEHLGFITMGLFAVALAVALRRGGIGPRWLFPVGVVAGVSVSVTAYEQYDNDVALLGALNGAANTVWFLWLIALGVVLFRRPAQRVRA